MTFWGVEVKPGKPFTLKCEDLAGKLILTQATLGVCSSAKKSILQCNVGDKSPVFLCSLLPDKSECCALNLEFEEDEDVKFSVVGPTSIHLSGFVHGDPQDSDEDGYGHDFYGEDIAGTESEESDYDSDEDSEDDFIDDDDDDMTMYPPSPVRNSGVVIEEIEDDEKASGENGTTKQSKKKKKNQLADSNNDQKALVVKGNTGATVLESEDEDGFPVSSSRKNEPSSEKCDTKTEGEQGKKNKKKNDAKDDDDARHLKRKIDALDQDEPKRVADDKTALAGATEVVSDEVMNKKKKKGKASEAGATQVETVAKSKDTNNTGAFESKNAQSSIGNSDDADVVNGDISENKKKKKKKKKAKTDNGEADANTAKDAVAEAKKTPPTDERAKQSKAKPAKVRTYPNGFVVEELQMGKPNGKRASRGSKVSVRYIGKLQKNGKQFDANIGRAPFKFRLGVGQVIKGWDVGVEGMRVGDKRRLIIPPSMGYGRDGAPPQIPPNAWLVFDVELVDVA